MTEELLIFLWKHKLYAPESLVVSDGSTMEVIHPGDHNRDAGPDFFNTRIKTGNTIWAGNAEVHVKASDWIKHDHNSNAAFQNVILHIVAENDMEITDIRGEPIPVITLRFNEAILAQYNYLLENRSWVSCARQLPSVDSFIISLWLEKLGIERLEAKTQEISVHLEQTQNNWEEVLYRMIMKSFGFHLNSQTFEYLAKSLPYKILEKHSESLLHTEALLYGQAGMLNELLPYDDYFLKIQKEYRFLAKKFGLRPLQRHLWKFLRMRPGNFPTIRIAQIASFIHHHPRLFASVREATSVEELVMLFGSPTSIYWNNHYLFGKVSKPKEKTIGAVSIESILINSVIPVLFIYGKKSGLEQFQNNALDFLAMLNCEKNSITENWQKLGIKAKNAFHTQALLQLKKCYCDKHLCLDCSIGNKILAMSAFK
jgi:hypothetical protein